MALEISNTDVVVDDGDLELDRARALETYVVGGTTYLAVGGQQDSGLSVFAVGADGVLTNIQNIQDDHTLKLSPPSELISFETDGVTYLYVTGEHAVSVFSVEEDGTLVYDSHIAYNDAPGYKLYFANEMATAAFEDDNYLIVGSGWDKAVSVFSIGTDGALDFVTHVDDTVVPDLNAVESIATAVVNGLTYLFVSAGDSDSVSVFRVGADGSLTLADGVDRHDLAIDGGTLPLSNPYSVTAAEVGGNTYTFVAGSSSDALAVFSVAYDGDLTNVQNVADAGDLNLDRVRPLTTEVIDGVTYLFAAGYSDNGFSVFTVNADGTLTNIANIDDDDDLALEGPYDVKVSVVDGIPTLFVAGYLESGVNVFQLRHNIVDESDVAVQVAENETVVATVDKIYESDPVTFSVVGGADMALFTVDPTTGVVAFLSGPDFETPADHDGDNAYEVDVQADDGVVTETKSLTVEVTDVSDTAPEITSDGGGDTANVTVAEHDTAVTTVVADDPEETAAYSIVVGDDAALFAIDSVTGVLSFLVAPDFETPADTDGDNVYEVTVAANDGLLEDQQALFVEVVDINDTAPEIISDGGGDSANVTVAENDTAVTTVVADDSDGTPTFSIVGGDDAALFAIDPVTGVLTFLTASDFEMPADADADNVYDVTVAADDGLFEDQQALSVEVTDVAGLWLPGTKGKNTLTGTNEADYLSGRKGKDTLNGLAGSDILDGGKHKDILTGGEDADGFLFDCKLKNKWADTITDFEVGVDTIQLDTDIFDKLGGAGTLKAKYFDFGKKADTGKDRILFDGKVVRYDADGKGGDKAIKVFKVTEGDRTDRR